jgi:hypothetical protein
VRRIPLLMALMLVAASVSAADRTRSFSASQPAKGIASVVLKAGVGDVEILAQSDDRIDVGVEAHAKRMSFWSSSRGEETLDRLILQREVRGSTLYLSLRGADHDDRDFAEDWSIRLPARLAVRVKLGVGDVRITDVAGDLKAEVGVGDVRIEGVWSGFGAIHAKCGVGDTDLRSPEGRREGEGFLSRSLDASGPGEAAIDAATGVGDVTIKLR